MRLIWEMTIASKLIKIMQPYRKDTHAETVLIEGKSYRMKDQIDNLKA